MRIGIDFDNTIITYDEVFLTAARERALVGTEFEGRKQAIRDSIRLLPDGEAAWMGLQGHVYGKGIAGAKMFTGVDAFLRRCRSARLPVVIVSHKTEHGHYDPDRVNLRQAALDWMAARGFFTDDGYAIPAGNVYFEDTRSRKLARIAALQCTHFIDDLEEVLTDAEFPPEVSRILFSDGQAGSGPAPYTVCPTWGQIEEHIFHERH
jgi:hypothetical protein